MNDNGPERDTKRSRLSEASCEDGGPGEKKRWWTEEEDKLLLEHVRIYGEGKWHTIAEKSGLCRSGKSCRLRYLTRLHKDLKVHPLTPQEKDKIVELQAVYGNKWAKIAAQLEGRTDNQVKNYWNTWMTRCQRSLKPTYPFFVPLDVNDPSRTVRAEMHELPLIQTLLPTSKRVLATAPVLNRSVATVPAESSFPHSIDGVPTGSPPAQSQDEDIFAGLEDLDVPYGSATKDLANYAPVESSSPNPVDCFPTGSPLAHPQDEDIFAGLEDLDVPYGSATKDLGNYAPVESSCPNLVDSFPTGSPPAHSQDDDIFAGLYERGISGSSPFLQNLPGIVHDLESQHDEMAETIALFLIAYEMLFA